MSTTSRWPARVIDEFDVSDRRANELARGLTLEQFNWKPSEGQWSIGQCLHHLYVANQVYLPAIAKALDHQQPAPVEEITPGWFGRWFVRSYIEPSPRSKRARAPRKIAPAQQLEVSVLDQFVRSNDVARDLVRRAGDYDVNRIRFVNPLVPFVRFTVGTGLEIVWRHQRRHLLQAERVTQASHFPKQSS